MVLLNVIVIVSFLFGPKDGTIFHTRRTSQGQIDGEAATPQGCRAHQREFATPVACVEFRARERAAAAVITACDEHLAVGQQRRRVQNRVRWRGCRWPSRSRSPDRRVPRSRESRCRYTRLRRAPCRWAATSPCDNRVRWRGCRWPSRSRSPDRRVPRSRE